MPTIRYVQRPSAVASSAHVRPETVSSGAAPGGTLAGAGRPDLANESSHGSSVFAGPAAAAANEYSSNNNEAGNPLAAAEAGVQLPSAGVGRLSAPPPHVHAPHGAQLPPQAQSHQKAVVTPNHPTAASRYDADPADQFADAEEDEDEEEKEVDNDNLLASALLRRRHQQTTSTRYSPFASTNSSVGREESTTKPAAAGAATGTADNSTTPASASASMPTNSTFEYEYMPMPPLGDGACTSKPAEPSTTGNTSAVPNAHKMHTGQFEDALPTAEDGGANATLNISAGAPGARTCISKCEEPSRRDAELSNNIAPGQQQMEQGIEISEKEEEAQKEGQGNDGDITADTAANKDAEAGAAGAAVGGVNDASTSATAEAKVAAADADTDADADADATGDSDTAEEELPPAFKVELGKAILRLQKQVKEDVLDKSDIRSIGCILGKRHKLVGPTLFKETLELPEVKDSGAATEDTKERIAKWEAVVETKDIIEGVGPHDVLFGRGGRTNIHEGNVYYRAVLQKYKMDYINASKNTKPDLSKEIVYIWRNLEPPGRFLRIQEIRSGYNPNDPTDDSPDVEVWEEVGNNRAQQKTSQCLRERNAQLRAAEGITALFRVGEAEKREILAREEERRQAERRHHYAINRVATVAAYRARAAGGAMPPYAYGMPSMPAAMGGYYPQYYQYYHHHQQQQQQQQQSPLLKRRVTADGTTPPFAAPASGALSLVTPTAASPSSTYQKRPRLGYPEAVAPSTAVPAAPLWQQASMAAPVAAPVAAAPAVGMAPYGSTDVSAQVAAEVEQIASLKEKIKAAQGRIETAHQRIGASKPDNTPGLSSIPATTNPAIPAPTMPQTHVVVPSSLNAQVLPAVPPVAAVPVAPPAPTIPGAPVPAIHQVAAAPAVPTAIPPPAYPAAAGQFPPAHQVQPAYHLPGYPAEGLTAASIPAAAPNPAVYQPPMPVAAAIPAGGGAAYPYPPPPPPASTYTWFAGAKTTVPTDMSPS